MDCCVISVVRVLPPPAGWERRWVCGDVRVLLALAVL
jgi:hypothetical protein